ncbi:MAG: CopG family ribbon-helix-helix protein [Candidatus Binataceae bacterium]
MSDIVTVRIDRRTRSRLEKLAKSLDRSRSSVAGEAIRAYVDLHEWQVAEIKAALKEADSGDFASEADVRAVVKKWGRGAR